MENYKGRGWCAGAALVLFAALAVGAWADEADYVGASTCVGCHSERAEAFKSTSHGKRLPLVKDVPYEKSCETCHGPGAKHAAAGGDKNDPGFATIRKVGQETCLTCHKGGETKFWGISAHAQNGLDCTKCHGVHAGKGPKNLKLSATETCLQCHQKQRMDINLPSHHPVKEGRMSCADCHNPHGGESGNIKAETLTELCFKCHADKAGPFVHEHPPVAEDCSNCHVPHGSQNTKLLKRKEPFLCQQCHVQPHWDDAATVNVQRTYYFCTKCHNEIHGSDRKARFLPR
ncbi:MAG: DmsE family decaheme c-type cytochrome [Elusimicrobia bacterium]|nr:DmsE family decaheme c-type cytochrome [Elusimicrobiota bacterium]